MGVLDLDPIVASPTQPPGNHSCFLLWLLIWSPRRSRFLPAHSSLLCSHWHFLPSWSCCSLQRSWGRGLAERGHESPQGAGVPFIVRTSCTPPPIPHPVVLVTPTPRGPSSTCPAATPLFIHDRNSGSQGRVNFLTGQAHKGNWQTALGHNSQPQQEVMARQAGPGKGHIDPGGRTPWGPKHWPGQSAHCRQERAELIPL